MISFHAFDADLLQLPSCPPPLQALTLLVKYVFVVEPPQPSAGPSPAQASASWLPQAPVATLPLPPGRLTAPQMGHPMLSAPPFSPAVQVGGADLCWWTWVCRGVLQPLFVFCPCTCGVAFVMHPLTLPVLLLLLLQAVSRKLYRLLRRTFAQWQPSSSASLSKVRSRQGGGAKQG
jgi:hypothetical protein